MTTTQHHLYTLGVLAMIYNNKLDPKQIKLAIEQAIESAQALGLPVSLNALREGRPISTEKLPPVKPK